jgi:hypothetical protein
VEDHIVEENNDFKKRAQNHRLTSKDGVKKNHFSLNVLYISAF